jgi:1-deoxy-D-xylulose-5-phosphate synthase
MLLERIRFPQDLKALPRADLPLLVEEIREKIVQTVSSCGGHLSSNLGVVELTVALHYLFDAPEDKIVWDVGHQTYAHKILTGRLHQLPTLRQEGGLAGFPKREESPYDTFNAGHASTAISAALGMAVARDLRSEKHRVIAVVGDGSLTGGLSWEGLNQSGHLKRNLIVILNDNEMSISPNVGALSAYLNRLITGNFLLKMKQDVKDLMSQIPQIGSPMLKWAKRIEELLKGLVAPGLVFEELGFKYFGPIEGNNLNHLLETLEGVKKLKGPVLLHVLTRKGKGYPPAEKNPSLFHSPPRFEVASGRFLRTESPPTYTQAFSQALIGLAQEDDRIVGITAAMAQGTGLDRFASLFPSRFFDVGIAEQHAVTFAGGLACSGFLPVVAIYSTFLQRAYDQLLHDICLQNLHVVFALDRAGIVGDDGPTHSGIYDLSYLRHLPHMVVAAPKDENELGHLLKTAISHPGPFAIRYPRGPGCGVVAEQELKCLEIGKAEVLEEGEDILLLAIGSMVYPALQAARLLREKEGIKASVVNARFLKPLDVTLIEALVKKAGRMLTIEENVLPGGFGSAVLESLTDLEVLPGKIQIERMGLPDVIIRQGKMLDVRARYGLSADSIAAKALQMARNRPLRNSKSYRRFTFLKRG